MIDLYYEIKSRYGNVKRTRGYYLYTEKNIRLIDMYLDGGMSVMGRKSGQANLAAKQLLDKGLHAFLPSKIDYQLEKAVRAVLPEFQTIRFYHSYERAAEVLGALLNTRPDPHILPVWRAFLDDPTYQEADACLVTPVYPVPYGIIAAKAPLADRLPPSDKILPPLAASLAKAFFEVKRKTVLQTVSSPPRRTEKNEKQRSTLETALAKIGQQKSCYVFPHISEPAYSELVIKALDNRIILSPDYYVPSIIPVLPVYTELLNFFNGVI